MGIQAVARYLGLCWETVTVGHIGKTSLNKTLPVPAQVRQLAWPTLGVEKQDTRAKADRLLQRLLNYRVFTDSEDKMNLSPLDVNGGLFLVSQFTLAADTRKGNPPGFSSAVPPELGWALFDYLLAQAKQQHPEVASGRFGANMQVSLVNDGQVAFCLQV